jgi:predicted small lipoprotein YifL
VRRRWDDLERHRLCEHAVDDQLGGESGWYDEFALTRTLARCAQTGPTELPHSDEFAEPDAYLGPHEHSDLDEHEHRDQHEHPCQLDVHDSNWPVTRDAHSP